MQKEEKLENKQNNKMEKADWKEVYQGGGAHLERVKKTYEELGFEVKILPISPTECGECTICYQEGNEELYKLYVRESEENG